jgi:hypothetical protein
MTRQRSSRTRPHPTVPTSVLDSDPPPSMFLLFNRREWVVLDEDAIALNPGMAAFEGFAIYVRTGVSNAEKRHLAERHDLVAVNYAKAWLATPAAERDFDDTPLMRELAMVAPYIEAWNAQGRDPDTGEWHPVPPPAIAGAAAFDAIGDELTSWCLQIVLGGYVNSGKVDRQRIAFVRTGATATPSPPAAPETTDSSSSPIPSSSPESSPTP